MCCCRRGSRSPGHRVPTCFVAREYNSISDRIASANRDGSSRIGSVTTIGLACAPEEPRTCEWMHCALLVTLRALLCSVPIVTPVAAGSDGTTLAFSLVASALAPSKGRGIFRGVAHSPPSSPDVRERHETHPTYPGLRGAPATVPASLYHVLREASEICRNEWRGAVVPKSANVGRVETTSTAGAGPV